jgi:DNA invertase Pin-like site-specific DNA recombinase
MSESRRRGTWDENKDMTQEAVQLNWAGLPIRQGDGYGGRREHMPAHVSNSQKRAQSLNAFRQLIKAGMTECNQIAQAMGVPKYTVSRIAKRAKKAGWLDKVKRKYVIVER